MGCCVSSQANGSPYSPDQANASSRAITSSQPQLQSSQPRPSTHDSGHRHIMQNQPLSQHVNLPLKLHVWTTTAGRSYTRKGLERERREFFETRVTNREEIWQAIHQALEVLWAGGDPEDEDGGLSTAQAILDAANITLPTGDIARGVYDTFGNHYKVPRHIVSNPTNLESDPPTPEEVDDESDGSRDEDKSESEVDIDEEELQKRREEKGKAPVRPEDEITILAKLSDRENRPLKLTINKQDSVRLVNRKLFEISQLELPKRIKIMYLGRILKENESLEQQGYREGDTIQGFVYPH